MIALKYAVLIAMLVASEPALALTYSAEAIPSTSDPDKDCSLTSPGNDSSGKPRDHVCRIAIEVVWDAKAKACYAKLALDTHTKRKHRIVEWFITNSAVAGQPTFTFIDSPSIPGILLNDQSAFARWELDSTKTKLLWRTIGKGSSTYLLLIQFQSSDGKPAFCSISDPVIANDDDDR